MRLRSSLGSSGFHPRTVRGPSGSPMRALQVRLNRGSTSCTACRGAAAAWARRAIGLADLARERSNLKPENEKSHTTIRYIAPQAPERQRMLGNRVLIRPAAGGEGRCLFHRLAICCRSELPPSYYGVRAV